MKRRRRKRKLPTGDVAAPYQASKNTTHKPQLPRIHPWELCAIEPYIKDVTPRKTYLEIGSFLGGSLRWMAPLMEPGARIISVDGNTRKHLDRAVEDLRADGYDVIQITGNTQHRSVVDKVDELAKIAKPDILLIDADHSAVGVMRDIGNYTPMVRKGGVVIFHDAGQSFSMKGVSGCYNSTRVSHAVTSFATGRRSLLATANCGTAIVWV